MSNIHYIQRSLMSKNKNKIHSMYYNIVWGYVKGIYHDDMGFSCIESTLIKQNRKNQKRIKRIFPQEYYIQLCFYWVLVSLRHENYYLKGWTLVMRCIHIEIQKSRFKLYNMETLVFSTF